MCIQSIHIMGNKISRAIRRDPFPNRQGEINQKTNQINNLNQQINTANENANAKRSTLKQTIADKNGILSQKAEREIDKPLKEATLYSKEQSVLALNNNIMSTQDNIDSTFKGLEVTKGGLLVTTYANSDTQHDTVALIHGDGNAEVKQSDKKQSATVEQFATNDALERIHAGMNNTNHSLNSTIEHNQNGHTTDDSRVTYQLQQTEYFSTINRLLLFFYMFLLFILAGVSTLYRIPANIGTTTRVFVLILLMLLPFISAIYYKYIV